MAELEQDLNFDGDFEELVAKAPDHRNWKGIGIALLVIALVIALIVLAVYIVTPPDKGPRIKGHRLALADVVGDRHKPRLFNGTWVSGSELLFIDVNGGLTVRDFSTNRSRILMTNSTFRQLNSQTFSASADLQYVLIAYDIEKVFRHTFNANYALYSANSSSYSLVSLPGGLSGGDAAGDKSSSSSTTTTTTTRLQLAEWSPVGHAVVFVSGNDLYYQADVARPRSVRRLTDNGQAETIYNGVPDWLYEEEILSSSKSCWFSPDGTWLLFATYNDSQVGRVSFIEYGGGSGGGVGGVGGIGGGGKYGLGNGYARDLFDPVHAPQYPTLKSIRYPKSGTPNPQVTLSVTNLKSFRTVVVTPPSLITESDFYFTSVRWINKNDVAVVWMNRLQNMSVVSRCAAPRFRCKTLHTERVPGGHGWIDNTGAPHFSSGGQSMVFIQPVRDSRAGYFPQLVQMDALGGETEAEKRQLEPTSLTHGTYHVVKIVAWDEESHMVYYIATLPGQPGVRHLFRVGDLDHQRQAKANATASGRAPVGNPPVCLTCNTTCQYNMAVVSPGTSDEKEMPFFYVQDCLGPQLPWSSVHSLPDNRLLQELDTNADLNATLSELALPKQKLLEIELPDVVEDVPARVRLLLPPGLREEEEYKFPVIVNIYGGPGSQDVSSRWSLEWDHYLASQKDFVVVHMDVRGSGFSGNAFKHSVHKQLGTLEVKDSLYVLEELLKKFAFLDSSKVAVWGWSYGGFLAARMLADDKESRRITCTTAVAPVTRWQLYDSAYTERYMGFPNASHNWKGYEKSDVTLRAADFHGRNLLVIHGSADENVQMQHTMAWTKTMVDHNVLFKQQIYPDQSHSLPDVRVHQFKSMESFLNECLAPLPDHFADDKKNNQASRGMMWTIRELAGLNDEEGEEEGEGAVAETSDAESVSQR